MSEEINGWTPPIIHDDYAGKSRIATQEDINRMQESLRRLGVMFQAVAAEVDEIRRWRDRPLAGGAA